MLVFCLPKNRSILLIPRFDCPTLETCEPDRTEHLELYAHGIRILVPLRAGNQTIGVLALGEMFNRSPADEGVQEYLEAVSLLVGMAAHNATMVASLVEAKKELEHKNLLVTTLFESARDFTGARNREELLRILGYRLMGQLMVSTFAIYLSEPIDEDDVFVSSARALHLDEIKDIMLSTTFPMMVADMPDGDAKTALETHGIAMVAPMTAHGRVCGAIAVQSKLNALPFTSDELSFLEAIGNTAIVAIENSRLYLQELEVQRMESELKIAAQIQRGLLPVDVSIAPELDIAASAATSKMIGGDYYDVIRLDEDRVLFAIADVSGKGVPAALLMANVQAALNVLARLHLPLHTLATRLNELVCENTEPEVFVTMFLCVINTSLQSIEYVNIGHNPQILLHGNDLELLTEGGIVAGVIPHPPEYRCGVGSLYSGDTLVLYTDGVTEARNGLTEFGLSALVDVVRAVRAEPASKIVDAVTAAVHNHSQRKELDDDTTLLIIKYL